jgi:hypothetical protein
LFKVLAQAVHLQAKVRGRMTPRWRVDCWNCDEGYVEPVDEWSSDVCDICKGKGALIVTELSDDNYDTAVKIDEPQQLS